MHATRSCTTCFADTDFAWLTEYFGKPDETVVGDAGEAACTVCYLTAPVEILRHPCVMEPADRRAARLARETKSAAKAVILNQVCQASGGSVRPTSRTAAVKP
ncbi:hypothetical protein [Rathayibacter rathayi]|uniref:Uncharacterized protein n=1 Tax=Rathayibacter rathayi TaxID=33887 RepID=A0ABX5AGH6_RATRA|nr:hypothetical protein [Rathayibacter rathayi]PPF24278.1 hypothetical protein C5C34_05995 [Rathayibacter rathayi]PPF51599.1 hypothetical protein C5C08_01985 [Rathayibacter rathayi]PPF83190.1 hypothetical protein C5C14_02025 [Rathayibacter rathayi]PPG47020.1 hypothetical protein C5C20_01980 [Rathayibacter rathayi]PPG96519.1 hypothetical protein C5C22_02545 [Rathayibacter rathayi]